MILWLGGEFTFTEEILYLEGDSNGNEVKLYLGLEGSEIEVR